MRHAAVVLVKLYRGTAGLLVPARCKYHPSCSQYAIDALSEFGFLRGSALAAWRLLRCNPWSHGGVDHARDQGIFYRSATKASRRHAPGGAS